MQDEPALIGAAKKLDADALTAIFARYAPAIYSYVYRWCHDEVESDNLVGDTFYALLQQFSAGKEPEINLRTYLFRMAYELVIDHARHIQYLMDWESVIEMPLCLEAIPTKIQANERILLQKLLFAINNDLSELQRHVIMLRFLEGFTLQETAIIIGKQVNHVKVIQKRGMAGLRKSLCF
jgi:RNA polymerase sigma-70 factor, ECF subfamily